MKKLRLGGNPDGRHGLGGRLMHVFPRTTAVCCTTVLTFPAPAGPRPSVRTWAVSRKTWS
jgi:hypothetical protein